MNGNMSNVRCELYRGVRRMVVATLVVVMLLVVGVAGSSAADLEEVTGFGSNPGNLRMFKYIPSTVESSPAMVVALHGCRQKATLYDDESGWVKLADRYGFVLLLPEQKGMPGQLGPQPFNAGAAAPPTEDSSLIWDFNNPAWCFNWFNFNPWPPQHIDIRRDSGEALSIKQMIDKMNADHHVDSDRVYISGVSAGGAMSCVMMATYPEVFAGGAIIAGIPYRCADHLGEAQKPCMQPGRNRTPEEWGNLVREASNHTGPWPRVSIWHGETDQTVNPNNATEIMEQWTNVHGIDQQPDEGGGVVNGHTHKVYADAAGNVLVETYLIKGMGHGVPIDPGPGDTQCGVSGPWMVDADICSSYFTLKFWGLDQTTVALRSEDSETPVGAR